MTDRVSKSDLIERVTLCTDRDKPLVEEIVEATFEEITAALKDGTPVSVRDFGTFYVWVEHDRWVFKFNPSQRLRAVFGWSSTYRREQ